MGKSSGEGMPRGHAFQTLPAGYVGACGGILFCGISLQYASERMLRRVIVAKGEKGSATNPANCMAPFFFVHSVEKRDSYGKTWIRRN